MSTSEKSMGPHTTTELAMLSWIDQTAVNYALYSAGMDIELCNSLEAIANLLYLIRRAPNDAEAVSIYVGLAEDRMKTIARQFGTGGSGAAALATYA
jgi:hypothetical protein